MKSKRYERKNTHLCKEYFIEHKLNSNSVMFVQSNHVFNSHPLDKKKKKFSGPIKEVAAEDRLLY
jgi:hypothetical protein